MASRLQDVILRGLATDKPLAGDVAPGTLYYSSDTSVTERSNGITWESFSDSGTAPAAHATTHNDVGSDELDVKLLGGYPGGTTTFLRGDGTFATIPTVTRTGLIGMTVDGGGSVISTGLKGYVEIPFACTIIGWTLLADVSGSIVLDIWKDTYANYPPTVADTITASAKPTISSAIKNQSSTLTGWNPNVIAGDIFGFSVDSASTITKIMFNLKIEAV